MAHAEISPRRPAGGSIAAAIAIFCCAACASGAGAAAQEADTAAVETTAAEPAPPGERAPETPRIRIAVEKRGEVVVELYPAAAPKAVERILSLVRAGFYDGLKFHRVESYLVQAGQAESDLPPVEGEMFGQKLTHEEGMVGMPRLLNDYDSATTQFYICKKHLPLMNNEYTLFGKVTDGMDIVHKIKKGDKIASIAVVE